MIGETGGGWGNTGSLVGLMKLYTSPRAPNPRRVHVLIAEKGLEVPTQVVDLSKAEHFGDDFQAISPDRVVPALVLDDGTVIHESIAICRYLDAAFPERRLFGSDPRSIGLIEMWSRQIELQLYVPTQDAYRNSRPGFADRALPGVQGGVVAIPELVPRSNATAGRLLDKLDRHLERREFIVGEELTMPDIMGVVALDFGERVKMEVVQDLSGWPSVERWRGLVSERPSFRDN